jgi:hypothetical protein
MRKQTDKNTKLASEKLLMDRNSAAEKAPAESERYAMRILETASTNSNYLRQLLRQSNHNNKILTFR